MREALREMRFGDHDGLRARRSQICGSLNALAATLGYNLSYTDMCLGATFQVNQAEQHVEAAGGSNTPDIMNIEVEALVAPYLQVLPLTQTQPFYDALRLITVHIVRRPDLMVNFGILKRAIERELTGTRGRTRDERLTEACVRMDMLVRLVEGAPEFIVSILQPPAPDQGGASGSVNVSGRVTGVVTTVNRGTITGTYNIRDDK